MLAKYPNSPLRAAPRGSAAQRTQHDQEPAPKAQSKSEEPCQKMSLIWNLNPGDQYGFYIPHCDFTRSQKCIKICIDRIHYCIGLQTKWRNAEKRRSSRFCIVHHTLRFSLVDSLALDISSPAKGLRGCGVHPFTHLSLAGGMNISRNTCKFVYCPIEGSS